MTARVRFLAAAETDLRDGFDWYEQRQVGLGAEFVRCIDSCVELIRRHPELGSVIHRQVRRALIRRFPYSIMYLIDADVVVVIAIFHAARDPNVWKRRA
jgi:plasmid stabilization system protein ParE